MPRKPKRKGRTQANGQGTKTVLPSGRVRWRLRDANDTIIASGTVDDDKTANDAIAAAMTARAQGTLEPKTPMPVAVYFARWLEARAALGYSTRHQYAHHLDLALKFLPADLSMQDTRAHHIRTMLSGLAQRTGTRGLGIDQPTASDVLAKILTRVRSVYREAQADRIITHDPTISVKRAKVARVEHPGIALEPVQAVRFEQVGTALHAIHCSRLWPALFTCISIGLRRGEVLALEWRHIRLDTGTLEVRQVLAAAIKGSFVLKPFAKTNAGNRDIRMPASLIRVLEAHQVAQRLECEMIGAPFDDRAPVFATFERTLPHPDNLARALNALLEWSNPGTITRKLKGVERHLTLEQRLKAIPVPVRAALRVLLESGKPLPDISPHDLRHTCITMWLRNGRPIGVVARDAGHENANVTYRTYQHVLPSERDQHVMDLFPAGHALVGRASDTDTQNTVNQDDLEEGQ